MNLLLDNMTASTEIGYTPAVTYRKLKWIGDVC